MTSEAEARPARSSAYHLPALLAEIADEVGLPAALAIAQLKGGTRVHFPATCADDHWLVAAVGREKADHLARHFSVKGRGGVSLTLPLGPTKLYDRARFRALEMIDLGHSLADTAREIGVSSRAVEKWGATERRRRATRRGGQELSPAGDVAHLTRAYDPVRHGLVSGLSVATDEGCRVVSVSRAEGSRIRPLPRLDAASLPGFLPEVAEVAGIGAAAVLGVMKGSRVLHVTGHAGRDGELASIVGPRSAAKLATHFRAKHAGRIELLVPRCPPETLVTVAAWTLRARDEGCTAVEVADWLGITPAIVEHLCAALRAAPGSGFSFRGAFPFYEPAAED